MPRASTPWEQPRGRGMLRLLREHRRLCRGGHAGADMPTTGENSVWSAGAPNLQRQGGPAAAAR